MIPTSIVQRATMLEKQPKPILTEGAVPRDDIALTRGKLWVAALLLVASLGCMCGGPPPTPTALHRVAEAVEHPRQQYFILTAQHVPEHIGQWVRWRPKRRATGPEDRPTVTTWVVPLAEADGTPHSQVMAWVHWTEPETGSDGTPGEGLRKLREELDGKRVRLRTWQRATKARRDGTPAGIALENALERHGLKTHPDAPLFHLNSLAPVEPEAP